MKKDWQEEQIARIFPKPETSGATMRVLCRRQTMYDSFRTIRRRWFDLVKLGVATQLS
jgi:hypothetical protein